MPEPRLEELSAYLDQELTGAARQELEAHLRECETCRRRLEALRHTVSMIQELPPEAPPRPFTIPAQRQQPRRTGPGPAPGTDPPNPTRPLRRASDSARYAPGGRTGVEAIRAGASAATADAGKAGLQLSLQRNGAGTVLPAPARLASSSGAPTFVGTYPVAGLPLPSGPGAYTLIASWTAPDGSGTILTAQLPIEIDG